MTAQEGIREKTAAPGKAAQPPAAERAYTLAKELILNGELPGGSLISEGEIAERVGVSRTPVREAFLRLQSEELLQLIPKRGAVVVPLAPGEAEDVLELRETLESAAVRRVLDGGEDAVAAAVESLRALLREQAGPARELDVNAFTRSDREFHRAIVAASGNALAERFYASLGDRQRRMSSYALHPRPERLCELVDEHEALVEHIARRDGAAFTAALRAHLDRTHRTFGGY
ncbi:GntR family transcriptional regulator [Streptomyces sp. ODS28]|uniref:GntR family transcriptional regulator n=1 Tax=Streptomyces sp. ODS28 TaxID=3136688 RepID=UPI0031E7B1D9